MLLGPIDRTAAATEVAPRSHEPAKRGDARLVLVNVEARPDLAERFRLSEVPTLVVVQDRRVVPRLVSPRGTRQLERGLAAWLH
jgi:thioredoxin-like negative regulator of GroEL